MNEITSEIFRGTAGAFGGVPAGPGGNGMPIPGSLTPGRAVSFSGTGQGAAAGVASQFNFGVPNAVQDGKVELETSPVQYPYLCPPGGEDSDARYAMPDMPAFSINLYDPEEGSTPIVTLAKLNQYLHDSYKDFERASNPANGAEFYETARRFKELLERHGERGLETYHQARRYPALMKRLQNANVEGELNEFYKLASQDLFCWLTKHGILGKINYLGPIITNGRDVTLEAENDVMGSDHYCVFNIALGKRTNVANLFGSPADTTAGTVLWLMLTRKQVVKNGQVSFGEFQVVPYGNKSEPSPPMGRWSYVDASGRAVPAHRWCVGKVIETKPNVRDNSVARINAANIGIHCSERLAYEDHGALPVLTILAGFK